MKKHDNKTYEEGLVHLLEVKDSDIRILTLEQCRESVDNGLHSGGAFSATIPLVSLYYGGYMEYNVEQPTLVGQDMFVLSKGHAIAALASIYADLGYFPGEILKSSRSIDSILNGHPGPILPGIHISTGPLGQGIGVAEGFAINGKQDPSFDAYCMVGDGELQEGIVWEAIMYSTYKQLDNFCVMVDRNYGQLDTYDQLVYPMENLAGKFESFGWNVLEVDARTYGPVMKALKSFKEAPRNGKPTAIICNTTKGYGSFNKSLCKHKVTLQDAVVEEELSAQRKLRKERLQKLQQFIRQTDDASLDEKLGLSLRQYASKIHLDFNESANTGIQALAGKKKCKIAPVRSKRIHYAKEQLPVLDKNVKYSSSDINTRVLGVFSKDNKIISIDADLSSTSGLEAGISPVDPNRALNVGVAEANMMNLGEAFAVLGYNVFVSTFCPFFDWKVMRRIAVGYQERIEDIASQSGWLSEGHGLDITFLATASNLDTRTNGATHMGNDDIIVFSAIGHLKIIDVSCPQQQIAILKWISEGNRGLVYLRVMRAVSSVLYDPEFIFDFGKGYILKETEDQKAWIISSGRGTHEACATAEILKKKDINIGVVDMPSIDESMLLMLYDTGKPLFIAEQNNGYIWSNLIGILTRRRELIRTDRIIAINTLDEAGKPWFIHSGTYEELTYRYQLNAEGLSRRIIAELEKSR